MQQITKSGFFLCVVLVASSCIAGQLWAESTPSELEVFIKQAEAGDVSAQLSLGAMYYRGESVPQNYKKAFYWFTKAAEQGNSRGQSSLGAMYHKGTGVPRNYEKAVYWYNKAAEQGQADAQNNLAIMYSRGDGVLQDHKKAFYWHTKAAEQELAYAQYNLGVMYFDGEGVLRDCKKAVYWYNKAAEQGYASAQYNLGAMYANGRCAPLDYKKAFYWYTLAAEQGDPDAQNNLGVMYANGQGVLQNYKKAVYWYNKASKQGKASAQFNLGVMHATGRGVPQNYKLAYVWSSLAAAQGEEKAKHNRDILSEELIPQQLAQARALAVKIQYKIDNLYTLEDVEPQDLIPKAQKKISRSGTGFIITKDGYVLTCHHVLEDGIEIKIAVGEDIYPAKLIRDDPNHDVALLKISGNFPALAFSSSRSAKMGQDVFTIGYPNPSFQGISTRLTKGTVKSLTGFQDDVRFYQISVPVLPGNSGGPLLDMDGNIIGIIVAAMDATIAFNVTNRLPRNVNYAVKSTYAKALLDTLPEVSEKLLAPSKKQQSFSSVTAQVTGSIVMIMTYE